MLLYAMSAEQIQTALQEHQQSVQQERLRRQEQDEYHQTWLRQIQEQCSHSERTFYSQGRGVLYQCAICQKEL